MLPYLCSETQVSDCKKEISGKSKKEFQETEGYLVLL